MDAEGERREVSRPERAEWAAKMCGSGELPWRLGQQSQVLQGGEEGRNRGKPLALVICKLLMNTARGRTRQL